MKSAAEFLRARHRSWPDVVEVDNIFAGATTIDPAEVEQAWSILSKSTWELEIAAFPALLHQALIATLVKESSRAHDHVE